MSRFAQPPVARSWYQQTLNNRFRSSHERQSLDARICIIGGGFAGLATAIGLLERGCRDVVLLEAGEIGHGASGRNGGFVFGGYSLPPQALIKQQGAEQARAMYQLTTTAVDLIEQRVHRYTIDCQFNRGGVLLADWFGRPERLRSQQQLMNRILGCNWQFIPRRELRSQLDTDRYYDGLLEPGAAHFHPLRYVHGLAAVLDRAGIPVWQQTAAHKIGKTNHRWQVDCGDIRITADTVVLACGGYQKLLSTRVARGILPIATYIMVIEPVPDLREWIRPDWAIYDTRFAFDYYRPLPDKRLLWGGRISIRDPHPQKIEQLLRRDLRLVFPALADVPVDFVWSGLMGYPRQQMPLIGETRPGLWHLTGFGGHGVAPTTALGELLAAALLDGDQRYRWFAGYRPRPVYGKLGMLAAQSQYWYQQLRDGLR